VAVGSTCGEAVDGGAVGARHARWHDREAAVGTPAPCPNRAFKAHVWRGASVWQPRGDGALTGGPGMGSDG
jgi:hypothetical protein